VAGADSATEVDRHFESNGFSAVHPRTRTGKTPCVPVLEPSKHATGKPQSFRAIEEQAGKPYGAKAEYRLRFCTPAAPPSMAPLCTRVQKQASICRIASSPTPTATPLRFTACCSGALQRHGLLYV